MDQSDLNIETVLTWFSRIYLGGIPAMITDDSTFLFVHLRSHRNGRLLRDFALVM